VGSLIDKVPQCRTNNLPNHGVPKILMISSDYEAGTILKEGLEKYGFKVYYFVNVFAAIHDIEKTRRVNYEIILCDIKACSTEYLLFAKQIRELSHTENILYEFL
jgi:DNA-binding response OmpR family regulator